MSGMKKIDDTLSVVYERTQNVCNDVSSKYGAGYLLAIFVCAIAISNSAFGSIFFDECPAEPYVPIYLVVNGCLMVALVILLMCPKFMQNVNHSHIRIAVVQILGAGVGLFLIGWLIRGSMWAFSLYKSLLVSPAVLMPKCNPVLYGYAFLFIISSYVVIAGHIAMFPWHYRKKCKRQEEQETEAQETMCA